MITFKPKIGYPKIKNCILNSRQNLVSFALGLFTFLSELIILRQMSIFLGSGIEATGLIILLFMLGMGLGNMLLLKNFEKDYLLIFICSISLLLIALSPQIIYKINTNKLFFVYLLSLFTIAPGLLIGFFYAKSINNLQGNKTIVFIFSNTLGSILGCILSTQLLKFIGVKEILAILAYAMLPFIFKKKYLFALCFMLYFVLFYQLFKVQPEINSKIHQEIISETKKIPFPKGNITPVNPIFKKTSLYGDVTVDQNYQLFVNNDKMCGIDLNDERIYPAKVNNLYPNPTNVLLVGLGCGLSLDEYLKQNANKDLKIKVLEINPVVVEAEKLFFKDKNPLDDPRVELIIADGFSYLLNSKASFDMIIVDTSSPVSLESSKIYTQDFAKLLSSHLGEKNILVWRCPFTNSIYDQIFYQTIRSVFPYATINLLEYSLITYATKIPNFIELTKTEIDLLNYFENEPFQVNSINNPVIK